MCSFFHLLSHYEQTVLTCGTLSGEKGAYLEMGPKQNQTLLKYPSKNFTGSWSHWPEGTYGTHLGQHKTSLEAKYQTKSNLSKSQPILAYLQERRFCFEHPALPFSVLQMKRFFLNAPTELYQVQSLNLIGAANYFDVSRIIKSNLENMMPLSNIWPWAIFRAGKDETNLEKPLPAC